MSSSVEPKDTTQIRQTRSGKEYPTPSIMPPKIAATTRNDEENSSFSEQSEERLLARFERRLDYFVEAVEIFEEDSHTYPDDDEYRKLEKMEKELAEEYFNLDHVDPVSVRKLRDAKRRLVNAEVERKKGQAPPPPSSVKQTKLPSHQDIPKFYGDPKAFPIFWAEFKIRVWDQAFEKPLKLGYLQSAIKHKPMSELLEGLDAYNYEPDEVEALLKSKYEKPGVLLAEIIDKIREMPRFDSHTTRAADQNKFHSVVNQIYNYRDQLGTSGVTTAVHLIVSRDKISLSDLEQLVPDDNDVNPYDITIDQLYNWSNKKSKLANYASSDPIKSNPQPGIQKFSKPSQKSTVRVHANTVQPFQCVFGDGEHRNIDCAKTLQQRLNYIQSNDLCIKCLSRDSTNHQCLYKKVMCRQCRSKGDRHHYLLCALRIEKKRSLPEVTGSTTAVVPVSTQAEASHQTEPKTSWSGVSSYYIQIEQCRPGPGYVPTGRINLSWKDRSLEVDVFYDRGTTHTMVTPKVAEYLRLPTRPIVPTRVDTILGTSPPYLRSIARVTVSSCDHAFQDEWEVYVSAKMPMIEVPDITPLVGKLPPGMKFCQPGEMIPAIVVGAWHTVDIAIEPSTPTIKLNDDIMLEKSLLGWSVLGRGHQSSQREYVHYINLKPEPCVCFSIVNMLRDPLAETSLEDTLQAQYLEDFTKRIRYEPNEKRFYASFTWLSEERPADNFHHALAATWRIFKTFNPPELLSHYQAELDTLVSSGYARQLANNTTSGYFIPHHPVLKEGSTTAIRPVFNASFSRKGEKSLNDLLFQGAWNQTNLLDCLLHWRTHDCAAFADIRKAFLQINLEPRDRKYVRFMWFKQKTADGKPRPQIYEMTSVLFGSTASPFMLFAVLYKLFTEYAPDSLKRFTDLLYMDDALLTADTPDELRHKIQDAQRILALGSFTLHKFACTPKLAKQVLPPTLNAPEDFIKVLGVWWHTTSDEIRWREVVSTDYLKHLPHKNITRREVASLVAKLFDPLGLLSPFTLKCREMIRDSFSTEGWDTPVPDELKPKVLQVIRELHYLREIGFPRVCINNPRNIVIDVYTDGSSTAYGACAYVASEPNQPSTLLCSRNRLSPKKQRTVHQLELCGAILGAEMGSKLKQTFNCPVRYFARTTVTVTRIRDGPQRQETYEAHRIKRVLQLTSSQDWHYIARHENPASLAANGRSLSDLRTNPLWRTPISPDLSGPRVHASRTRPIDPVQQQNVLARLLMTPFSRLKILVELFLMAADHRYKYLDRLGTGHSIGTQAFIIIWKVAQGELLKPTLARVRDGRARDDEPKYLKKKDLFIDQDGLLRMDSRLDETDVAYEQRFRLVLPPGDITSSFLKYLHNTVLRHASLTSSLAGLTHLFIIPDAEQRMRPIVDQCIRCRRYNAVAYATPMAPLPRDRVVATHAFDVVGIDIFGQLRPTPKKKRSKAKKQSKDSTENIEEAFYVLIFSCAQSRAIHLEPILSKSTASVKNALSRFCSLYGMPRVFYSDNERSFAQMNKWLRAIRPHVEKAIAEFRRVNPVVWHFNPARSPWYGGFYERLIQAVKRTLRAYQPSRFGSVDELYTILAEVQSMMNSRPLVRIPGEVDYLTPYHLLLGHGVQPLSYLVQAADPSFLSIIQGQKLIETKLNQLWRKWRDEYLPSLRATGSSASLVPRVGELVLLNDPTRYRSTWPIAVVQELHHDRHGVPHRATIKKLDGHLMPNISIKRLYPMEERVITDSSPH